MVALVSLHEVKSRLHFDFDSGAVDEDFNIQAMIEAASESIVAYLGANADVFLDTAGEAVADLVPARVKTATVILVGILLRGVDGDKDKDFAHGYLPVPVISLLYQMRDPTVA